MEKKEFLKLLKNVDLRTWYYRPSVYSFEYPNGEIKEIHDPLRLAKNKKELIEYFKKADQELYDFDECETGILVYFERKGDYDGNGATGETWGMIQVFEKKI